MKKLLSILILLVICLYSNSQIQLQDVVYLKNGNIIRGVIVEQSLNQFIKIETADKSLFVYKMDEIDKLTKEQLADENISLFDSSEFTPRYKGIVEVGYHAGLSDYVMDRSIINVINGYQISPNFMLGVGSGIRYYYDREFILVPIFAEFRTSFITRKVNPYISMGVGYSFDASYDFKSVGPMLNSSVGISFYLFQITAMHLGLGFEILKIDPLDQNRGWNRYYYYTVNSDLTGAASIVFGISF